MKKLLVLALAFSLFGAKAEAASSSFAGTLGSGAAFAAWCIGGTGSTCSGGVFWPATVLANSAGTDLFTSANPGLVDWSTSSQAHADLTAPTPCQTATAWNTNAAYGSGVTEPTLCDLQAAFWTDLGAVAGVQLGSPTNFGSPPGAVKALSANVSVFGSDPCLGSAKTNLPISQNGTSSVQLIALSGSTTIYVCSLFLMTNSTATTAAITTGTGTACVTNNAAVIGSTTSNIANSMNLIAGAGFTLGNGEGTIASGVASSELCMILGSNVYVSGNLTYVQK